MNPLRRAIAILSRRLDRPELLAAVYAPARQAEHEQVGIEAVLASTLRDGASYVDVGSNRGQILREAVRIAPHGRHLAFEPIPTLAQELAREFPSVDCRQKALGARRETAEFTHFRKLDGWSGLRRSLQISDELGDPELITVEVSTLDEELDGLAAAVVKIDVEGAELGVLEGGRALLARARPVVVFEHVAAGAAIYDTQPGALWDVFQELDYAVYSATGEGPFTREAFAASAEIVNWLAVPRA